MTTNTELSERAEQRSAQGASSPGTPSSTTIAEVLRTQRVALLLAAGALIALFWPVLTGLVEFWSDDPDFSHGFLVPAISVGILVANRRQLGALPSRRGVLGLALLVASLAVFGAGYLTRTNVVQRAGLWGSVIGATWFVFGSGLLKTKPFPFFFLLFMFPPPYRILSGIRLALKSFATQLSADCLRLAGFAAEQQGNLLEVGDHQLEVADACSGIRSLMAIVATAALFAYLFRTGWVRGALLIATAIPVTLAVNVLRILIVAFALVQFDIDLTTGWPHDVLGLVVFALSLALLFVSASFYEWLLVWKTDKPARKGEPTGGEVAA